MSRLTMASMKSTIATAKPPRTWSRGGVASRTAGTGMRAESERDIGQPDIGGPAVLGGVGTARAGGDRGQLNAIEPLQIVRRRAGQHGAVGAAIGQAGPRSQSRHHLS